MRELLAAAALTIALNAAFRSAVPPPSSAPAALELTPESAVESASFLSLGMRRGAADAALIRMLVYYGTPEADEDDEAPGHVHGAGDRDHPERSWGGGHYPELLPRARRILALDPGFSYAALWASGALAFNLGRVDEATALLELALRAQPGNWQYRAYLAAIGFQKRGDPNRVLALLEPTLAQPDCPTMIKSMVAFLLKRQGQRARAIAVYRDILRTSRDAGYRGTARRMLGELGVED